MLGRYVVGEEQSVQAVIDALPCWLAYVDAGLRHTYFNVVAEDILAATLPQLHAAIARALANEPSAVELQHDAPDGRARWLRFEHAPARGGVAILVTDITRDKLAALRLRVIAEASQLSSLTDGHAILDAIPELAVPALAQWAALYVDRGGVLVPEHVAHDASITEAQVRALARAITSEPSDGVVVRSHASGACAIVGFEVRHKRFGAMVFGTARGERWTKECLATFEELARRASAAVATATLLDRQRRANERLAEADVRKDELLAILGHELRNPLAPIVTAIDLISYRGTPDVEREVDMIRRQTAHLTRLVDDLLDVSRITRGKLEIAREPLALDGILAKAVEQALPLLEHRLQQLSIDVPRGLVVAGDAVRLAQVFSNLLTNASKFTPQHGWISVVAKRDGEAISVTVSDGGAGISAELLPHVFTPFVQGDRSLERSTGGLGLGLALVKSLVELHDGAATAASDGPGTGSRFTVTLPAVYTVPAPARTHRRPALDASGTPLLLVDDNVDAATVLASLLGEVGFQVAVAHDARAALEMVGEIRPAIALLDIGLPVVDGYELARTLRQQVPDVTLVAISGYRDHADAARSRAAGFTAHLGKPVDFDHLVGVLGKLPLVRRVQR